MIVSGAAGAGSDLTGRVVAEPMRASLGQPIIIIENVGGADRSLGVGRAARGANSLEFLQAIYRSATQPMARRLKAASIAIAYESPKLSATLAVQADDSWAAKLKNAIARSSKVEAYRLIQAAPTAANGHAAVHDSAAEVSAAASRRPMALIRRR
jgi:tripartite-type tricarboxylate transporter receptor subunit TctC